MRSISKRKCLRNFKNLNFYFKILEDKFNKQAIIVYLKENLKAKVIHKTKDHFQNKKKYQTLITIIKN